MLTSWRAFRNFDFIMTLVTIILIIFGVMMIASATRDVPSLADRVNSQILYAVAGLVIMVLVAIVDYRLLTGTYIWIYAVMVGFLGLVGILGTEGEAGAQSWVNFGIAGFQPSELAKIMMVIVLAQQLALASQHIEKLQTIAISFGFVAVPAFFIFIQPDLGITILVMVTWFVMVWAAGLRWEHLLLMVAVGLVAAPLLWSQMEDYQKERITGFLTPPFQAEGFDNIDQAIITVGNGGLLGRGYMQGTQSQLRFLRVRHTDFIYAVIAEELGFVGGVLVMALIGIVILRIIRAARLAPDISGSLICYGIATIIFFQTLVSVGMNLRAMPVTGLTLPFISSGGSSLVTLLLGLGLVQSVLLRSNPRDL